MFSWPSNSFSSTNRSGGSISNYQQIPHYYREDDSSAASHGSQSINSGGNVPQVRWLPSVLSRNNHIAPDSIPATTAPTAMPDSRSGQVLRAGVQPIQQGQREYTPARHGSQQQSTISARGSLAISNVVDPHHPTQKRRKISRYLSGNETIRTVRTTRAAAAAAAIQDSSVKDPSLDPQEHSEEDAEDEEGAYSKQDDDEDGERRHSDGDDIDETGEKVNKHHAGTFAQQHHKRLKTDEEISLFRICNRHGAAFGERNKLCEWWRTVTDEFTKEQGHPYSWHSVRRKVETVTKQRMRVLAQQKKQRELGQEITDDKSDSLWREVLDAWLPHWERFEEAERRRIEVRDSYLLKRKRKREAEAVRVAEFRTPQPHRPSSSQPTPPSITTQPGWPVAQNDEPAYTSTGGQGPGAKYPASNGSMVTQGVFLPSAYSRASTSPHAVTQSAVTGSTGESPLTLAILETLSKFNLHLDKAATVAAASSLPASGIATDVPQSDSSLLAVLTAGRNVTAPTSPNPKHKKRPSSIMASGEQAQASIIKLKEEIRTELRTEFRNIIEEKFDSLQRTQEMILEMLRQEPQ